MSAFARLLDDLKTVPRRWLVTGVAGFVGSNLLESLLHAGQQIIGLDNLTTGSRRNIDQALEIVPAAAREQFTLIEGDIRDSKTCRQACTAADYVLHQAALVSVPQSVAEPVLANEVNVTGFVNLLAAAREAGVKRVVYASSSAVYGDAPELPKVEDQIGQPMSPYGATKRIGEIYAGVFSRAYGLQTVGLRYFNVFGPRQDPIGPYAAVIPQWIRAMLRNEPVRIFGDGRQTRDFCHVADVVQANLLAATCDLSPASHDVFNVAAGERTSLLELFELLRAKLLPSCPHLAGCKPHFELPRAGDIPHSQADIERARQRLGFEPAHTLASGTEAALEWYRRNLK
jgi:UDP-N-acetylglucosamine/UDP-N-acetyl-alpha-D-glucosaminouronate 4-epimerase